MNYAFHIMILIEIYLILSLSLNLVVGYAGMLSLCHAVFYGIGAYMCALLMKGGLWLPATQELLIIMPLAIIVTVFFSLAISGPFFKLRGDYLALASIGLQTIFFVMVFNLSGLTKGSYGIPDIPEPKILGYEVTQMRIPLFTGHTPSFFLMSSMITAICVWLLYRIAFSPFGRAMKATREDEMAATSLGKNVKKLKVTTFAIAAGFAAVAGILFTTYTHYIDPTSFTLTESIFILSILIVGGAGNFTGPIVGTALMILLPEVLRFLSVPDTISPNIRQIIEGSLILLVMRYRPRGITGEYSFE